MPESTVNCESESSSDVEVEEGGREEERPRLWAPAPLPLCPRPLLLPHQQLAFGAGLAAFCEYVKLEEKHRYAAQYTVRTWRR